LPFEPIRFIHASNLRLDSQMTGIGECPDEFRGVIETATITAFERVIDASVAQNVDFVLLTGDSFDEHDRSLQSRIALVDGFHRLNEHGIRVFVLPGRLDPADAWKAFSDFPDNVTTFFDPSTEAVAVLRDGKVIASVACAAKWADEQSQSSAAHTAPMTSETRGPIRVGLCLAAEVPDSPQAGPSLRNPHSFDYVAIGCSHSRETHRTDWGIAHSPGATQPICSSDTGPHGCTLVEVADDGSIDCQLIATAAVRSERIAIGFDSQSSLTDLLGRMRKLLAERASHSTELLWLVNWAVAGSGPLYKTLCDDDLAKHFVERASAELHDDARPQILHSLQVLPGRAAVEQIKCSHAWADEYFNSLDAVIPLTRESLQEALADAPCSSDEFTNHMERLADGVDGHIVLGRARQFGIAQFGQSANRDT